MPSVQHSEHRRVVQLRTNWEHVLFASFLFSARFIVRTETGTSGPISGAKESGRHGHTSTKQQSVAFGLYPLACLGV